jgi:hypothetical protein
MLYHVALADSWEAVDKWHMEDSNSPERAAASVMYAHAPAGRETLAWVRESMDLPAVVHCYRGRVTPGQTRGNR